MTEFTKEGTKNDLSSNPPELGGDVEWAENIKKVPKKVEREKGLNPGGKKHHKKTGNERQPICRLKTLNWEGIEGGDPKEGKIALNRSGLRKKGQWLRNMNEWGTKERKGVCSVNGGCC